MRSTSEHSAFGARIPALQLRGICLAFTKDFPPVYDVSLSHTTFIWTREAWTFMNPTVLP